MGYLENETLCFTKVTEHNNIGFDHKVVEDEDGKEDGKKAVTNSKEEASKKGARRKAKRDAARALLFAAIYALSAPVSMSVFVPGSSAALPGLFAAMLGLSAAMPALSAAIPRLFVAVPGLFAAVPGLFAAVPRLSAFTSVSVPVLGLSIIIPPSKSLSVLLGSSPLPFPTLSLPKIPTPNLAIET